MRIALWVICGLLAIGDALSVTKWQQEKTEQAARAAQHRNEDILAAWDVATRNLPRYLSAARDYHYDSVDVGVFERAGVSFASPTRVILNGEVRGMEYTPWFSWRETLVKVDSGEWIMEGAPEFGPGTPPKFMKRVGRTA